MTKMVSVFLHIKTRSAHNFSTRTDRELTLEISAKETLYGDQFTLSAELKNLIILKYPHRRSPAVSLVAPPLYPSDAF